jgi:glucosyl-dolichyl phosphate glucuronosyltransferase
LAAASYPDNIMDVSVIICTFNRAESLRRTLKTCADLDVPALISWELVVVDNGSRDHTRQVCQAFTGRLPLRYVLEPKSGLSHARNCAISVAAGNVVVFTDDDVDVDPRWLANLLRAATTQPAASFFGGRVLPQWEKPPPMWVLENTHLLSGVIMNFDAGDRERLLERSERTFFGANMAFRRSVLGGLHVFDPEFGYKGKALTPGEETDFMRRLMQEGHRGCYVPDAVVYHRNPSERGTERFVRRWQIGQGIVMQRSSGQSHQSHLWWGAPRWLWKRCGEAGLRYVFSRCLKPSARWLRHEMAMAQAWGMICEHRQQRRSSEQGEAGGHHE